MPGKVFISHDRQDTSRCAGLLAALDAWGIDYWFDRQEASAAQQLSNQVQMALAESTVFLRICTPSTRRSFWMSMALGAFLGLQADDHHQGRDNQRRLVNVILDSGYIREPFDRTTTVLDATDTAHPEWVNDLREALDLPPLADPAATAAAIYSRPPKRGISRRQALGLGVAGAAVLAAAGAGGLVLLSNKGGSPTVHTPTPTPTPPTNDPRLQWFFPADDKIVSPPIVAGGVVYTASNTGTVYALDADSGTLLWSQPLREVISNAMALANGLLYVRAHTQLYVLDIAAQGKTKLHTESLFITEPAIVAGRLYIGQSPPEIDSLDPQNLRFLWSTVIAGNPSSAPAVVGNVAFVATDQSYLEAYSAVKSDTLIWRRKLGGSVLHSKPVVANGVVYIGSDDHRFYAFDTRTGADHWPKPFETGGVIEATALVSDGTVYVGSGDGVLYALDAATGKLRWSYKTGAPIFNVAPVLEAGVLYVASEDHHVYALDPANGKVLRSYECAGPILVTPAIVGDTLYVGDLANYVYAFHLT